MRRLLSCWVAALASVAACTAVACDNPTMVAIPDGKTATKDQLLAAQAEVKTYMAAMEQYLACLNEELEAAGDDAPAEFKSLMVTRHNTAVSEMEAVAQAFNEQVRAFREANPDAN
ncbi:MAG TPA: hypothetical protein VIN61_09800 [Gammaproteobacteria bacterium]